MAKDYPRKGTGDFLRKKPAPPNYAGPWVEPERKPEPGPEPQQESKPRPEAETPEQPKRNAKLVNAAKELGAGEYAEAIADTCAEFGIDTPLRQAHFIAQIKVESANFKAVKENLNYRPSTVRKLFGRHRISEAQIQQYAKTRDKKWLFDILYGGRFGKKNLGNTEPGDGSRFIGRGLKQLTGRDNYTRYSQDTYGDDRITKNPELLERSPDVAKSAGWYWKQRGLSKIADKDDIRAMTKAVNGGYNGLEDRKRALKQARILLEV